VYHDSEEGQRYIQFYKLNKFPYISILDPRTGELVSLSIIHSSVAQSSMMTYLMTFIEHILVQDINPQHQTLQLKP